MASLKKRICFRLCANRQGKKEEKAERFDNQPVQATDTEHGKVRTYNCCEMFIKKKKKKKKKIK